MGLKSPKRFFSPRLISLEEACKKAHEALGNTPVRDFIERLNSQHIPGYFIQDSPAFEMNFYGMHPPSTTYEIISGHHLKHGSFKNDGSYGFYPPYAPRPSYTGLVIEARQLAKYIKKRRNDYKEFNASFSQAAS